jgi:hypothetical protein
MPERKGPICELLIWPEADADPVVVDRGIGIYDIIAKTWKGGMFLDYANTSGLPRLEFIEGIGIQHRPIIVPKDTFKASFALTSTWNEIRPTDGGYRVRRLKHTTSDPSVDFAAVSNYSLPDNPHFAISLALANTPGDWDFANREPYVRVEVGPYWAIYFGKDSAALQWKVDGQWVSVEDVPMPDSGSGYADGDEFWVYFRVLDGKVCVSTDFGKTYVKWSPSEDLPTYVPSGKLSIRGRGGIIAFGVHQMMYLQARYRAQKVDTLTNRLIIPAASVTGWWSGSTGTDITFANGSDSRYASYVATFTPASQTQTPFAFYWTPTLKAVQFRYAVTATLPSGDPPEEMYPSEYIQSIAITEPVALDETTASVTVHHPSTSALDLEHLRLRKVRIRTGYLMDDDTEEWFVSFTGYVTEASSRWDETFGASIITIAAQGAAVHFRTARWDALQQHYLGGLTPNAAADRVLATEGIPANTTWRVWHPLGDMETIPTGTPDDPFELTQENDDKWSGMKRIFERAGLELGADENAVFYTVPKDYVSPSVDWTLYANAITTQERTNLVKSIQNTYRFLDAYTAVMIIGTDYSGNTMISYLVDGNAEASILTGTFCPWRMTYIENVDGAVTPGYLIGVTQRRAYEKFPIPKEASVATPVNPELRRRMRIAMQGFDCVSVPDASEWAIMHIQHNYNQGQGLGALTTTAGLRRIT